MSDQRDDKQEALEGSPRDFCKAWLEAIEASSDEEKPWRDIQAADAWKAYKGDPSSGSTAFNIFHSNIETIVPALYNSSPIPDVRRRFNDDDPVAAAVSEILERAISFSIDDYDFDETMKAVVKDMAVVDRGIARVKYEPTLEPVQADGDAPGMGHNGGPEMEVTYEEALCQYVPYQMFRRGPATQWEQVPWVAFLHNMSRQEVEKLVARSGHPKDVQATILGAMRYPTTAESAGDKTQAEGKELPKFGARSRVWEIWDKDTREVIFISEDYCDFPLARLPDPLKLKEFFPTPRPAMIIQATDTLTPITSYSIYCKLIDELNDVTERIGKLVKQLRPRGAYFAVDGTDIVVQLANADDGELVPFQGAEAFAAAGGGIDKMISWFPLEPTAQALKELIAQREVIKQTIYEVTGISDIIRGSTDANETATAQNIKQQWGSIRIQSHQKEVERYARDLFRLKAEIMCKHFSIETLLMTTGLKYPTGAEKQEAAQMQQQGEQQVAEYQQTVQAAQAAGEPPPPPPIDPKIVEQEAKRLKDVLSKPTVEEIAALMKNTRVAKYRVDIESDSTVRADLTKNQEQMKGFLDGFAAYAQAVGPMVQQGAMDPQVAIEIAAGFARNFRLGKQAEDALDKWADKIRKDGTTPPPPDPEKEAGAALKQAQAEKTKVETQLLPAQFEEQKAKDRATFRRDTQEKAANFRLTAEEKRAVNKREDDKMQLEDRRANADREMQDRHHGEQMKETRMAREDGQKLEHKKLRDGRQARAEGYAANEQTVTQDEFEDEYMTSEERELMAQNAQALAQVTQTLQGIAQAMMEGLQQNQQMAAAQVQAMQAVAKAINTPKRIVRDQSGRAVASEPVTGPDQA